MNRVLVAFNEILLGAGVLNLLSREGDLSVTKAQLEDQVGLLREVERHHPDILILDETLRSKQLSDLARIFQIYPDLRILVINPKENVVHVYEKLEIRVDRSADLLAAIRGGARFSNSLCPVS